MPDKWVIECLEGFFSNNQPCSCYVYFSCGSIQTLNDIKMIFNRSHDMKEKRLDIGAAFIYFCLD